MIDYPTTQEKPVKAIHVRISAVGCKMSRFSSLSNEQRKELIEKIKEYGYGVTRRLSGSFSFELNLMNLDLVCTYFVTKRDLIFKVFDRPEPEWMKLKKIIGRRFNGRA